MKEPVTINIQWPALPIHTPLRVGSLCQIDNIPGIEDGTLFRVTDCVFDNSKENTEATLQLMGVDGMRCKA